MRTGRSGESAQAAAKHNNEMMAAPLTDRSQDIGFGI
jgi:hypothetical protein